MMKKSSCRLGGAHAPFLEFGGKGEVALSCVLPLGGKLFFLGGGGRGRAESFRGLPLCTLSFFRNNKSFVQ